MSDLVPRDTMIQTDGLFKLVKYSHALCRVYETIHGWKVVCMDGGKIWHVASSRDPYEVHYHKSVNAAVNVARKATADHVKVFFLEPEKPKAEFVKGIPVPFKG